MKKNRIFITGLAFALVLLFTVQTETFAKDKNENVGQYIVNLWNWLKVGQHMPESNIAERVPLKKGKLYPVERFEPKEFPVKRTEIKEFPVQKFEPKEFPVNRPPGPKLEQAK